MKRQSQKNLCTSTPQNPTLTKSAKPKNKLASLGRLAAGWMILQTVLLATPVLAEKEPSSLSYGEFLQKLEQGEVSKVELDETNKRAKVTLKQQPEALAERRIIIISPANSRKNY